MATFMSSAVFNPNRNLHKEACCCPACVGLECLDRTRYFSGQLLTEADLNNEQSYLLAKNRLHNRFLHGWGVVCGLQVVCSDCDGWVTVKTGYAIDPCGNDIIVCEDQPFNVAKAIQACCTPPKTSDCAPLRSAPPPNCQDADQKWCITIQYEEQPSRPVTPLRSPSTKSSCGCGGGSTKGGCGCGSSKGGCGCGSSGAKSGTCCCSSSSLNPPSTTPGCEPTRILEGFKLGVCAAPTETVSPKDAAGKPTAGPSKLLTCIQALSAGIQQKPTFVATAGNSANYTAACNYLALIRKMLATGSFTSCAIITQLEAIQIPQPNPNDPNYTATLQAIVDNAVALLVRLAKDCLCLALLPTCPGDPCTNCLVLACVTVRNGKVIEICHFDGGRQQVITFPTLRYWLSLIGFDNRLQTLMNFIENLCCGESRLDRLLFMTNDTVASNSMANPAMLNRMFSTSLASTLGATVVNAAAPSARAIDLRPFVGLSQAEVTRLTEANKLKAHFVDVGPAWMDTSAAAGQAFAPSAFSTAQPLTVYTNNGTVVGFEATDPTESLRRQVASLQEQVDRLMQNPSRTTPRRPNG